MNILVTGSNGFVGQALIPRLLKEGHQVTALVRSKKNISNLFENVTWIEGDLLHPDKLPKLDKIDKSYFLVHGLKEGSEDFEYLESMSAVNFVNWIRPSGTSIVYLGALGPRSGHLSAHLRSRHLVGAIFGASSIPTIEFRASIVLGEGSLSFEMIKALAERVPFRPDMSLLSQSCQPISLADLLDYLVLAIDKKNTDHKIYEIGGADVVAYGELIELYAEGAHLKRKKLKLPEVETKVMMKVLDYAIPEYAETGKKLTQSLEYPTVVTDDNALKDFPEITPDSVKFAMTSAQTRSTSQYAPLWDKEFLRTLLSDKILTQSGLLSPDLLRNLEKMGKIRDIFLRK